MKTAIESKTVKVYYYGGFEKPELLASNFEEMNNVTVSSNYLGDMTEEFMEELEEFYHHDFEDSEDLAELNEMLGYYNMFANPTLEQLVTASLAWFDKNSVPHEHFEDFGNQYEVSEIANRTYDDFKNYCEYQNQYIIEDYIRHTHFDTVVGSFDSLSEAEEFMDEQDLWDDCTLFGVNGEGRAYYPQF